MLVAVTVATTGGDADPLFGDGTRLCAIQVLVEVGALRRAHTGRHPHRVVDARGVLGAVLAAVAGPLGMERAVLVDPLVGVRAEVVAQSLDECGRQPIAA